MSYFGEEQPKTRIFEIEGVKYEMRPRARYLEGFSYCSSCCVWWKRVDKRRMLRCPTCNRVLKKGGLSGKKGKRYIRAEDYLGADE